MTTTKELNIQWAVMDVSSIRIQRPIFADTIIPFSALALLLVNIDPENCAPSYTGRVSRKGSVAVAITSHLSLGEPTSFSTTCGPTRAHCLEENNHAAVLLTCKRLNYIFCLVQSKSVLFNNANHMRLMQKLQNNRQYPMNYPQMNRGQMYPQPNAPQFQPNIPQPHFPQNPQRQPYNQPYNQQQQNFQKQMPPMPPAAQAGWELKNIGLFDLEKNKIEGMTERETFGSVTVRRNVYVFIDVVKDAASNDVRRDIIQRELHTLYRGDADTWSAIQALEEKKRLKENLDYHLN
ncbi:hypothetical protein F5Y05DRAFT_411990 [Hypoxylon sp. FL0543]|nr:hypothetical protein F5Y05DRAFT_411990 [Hypoxylon sp. FL0543]